MKLLLSIKAFFAPLPEIPRRPTTSIHRQDVLDYVAAMGSLYGHSNAQEAIQRDLIMATKLGMPLAQSFYTEALTLIK